MTGVEPTLRAWPHDLEAERAVLSTLLTEPGRLVEIFDVLRSHEAFYQADHARIFAIAHELHERGDPIDPQTIRSRAIERGLGNVVLASTLARLVDATPAVMHVVAHAQIVLNKFRLRQLIETCSRIQGDAQRDHGRTEEFLVEAASKVNACAEAAATSRMASFGETDQELGEELEAQWNGKRDPWGMGSGNFGRLHTLMHGYGLGQLTVLTATTGGGKSSFALQEAVALAGTHYGHRLLEDGSEVPEVVGTAYLTLELPKKQLHRRALVQHSHLLGAPYGVRGWDLKEVQTGRDRDNPSELIRDQDNHRLWLLQQTRTALVKAPFLMDDTRIDVGGLRAAVMRAAAILRARGARLRFLVLDHIHLLRGIATAKMREDQVLGEIANDLKCIATELEIHVIALAQYKREAIQDMRKSGRSPEIQDIRGSSQIEQAADKILMLHRPWKLMDSEKQKLVPIDKAEALQRAVKAILGKHRDGSEGEVDLEFFGERFSFVEPLWKEAA